MNPEEREKLKARKAELEGRRADLEAELADVKGRAAVVSKGMKQIQRMQFEQSVKNQLYDYKNEIAIFRTTHQRILGSTEYKLVFKRPSCFELVKEYCAVVGALAVGAVAVGMSADPRADVDGNESDSDGASFHTAPSEEDEDPSEEVEDAVAVSAAVVSIIDRIGQCLSESERILREKIANENKATSDRYKIFYQTHLLGLKPLSESVIEKESLLSDTIETAIESKSITEEEANEMLCGCLDTIRRNREKSVLLSVCQEQLTPQLPSSKKSEFSVKLLDTCFLWDGVQLKLPDRLQPKVPPPQAPPPQAPPPQAPPPQAQAAPPQLQAQPPSVSGVFMKSKSKTFPLLTRQERFVTIDETGFSWFDKDTKQPKGSIPLGRIVGAEAAGKWGELFGVDIMHSGDEDHTYLWCETLPEQQKIIATVRALVALKKGGNKNRKTIIKYRKRRHQNKKKTHKKNANKKSTKKNIRKSKTKKNN